MRQRHRDSQRPQAKETSEAPALHQTPQEYSSILWMTYLQVCPPICPPQATYVPTDSGLGLPHRLLTGSPITPTTLPLASKCPIFLLLRIPH